MMNGKELFSLFAIIFFLLVVVILIIPVEPIPDVWVSYSTGECLAVNSVDHSITCDNLPRKYNKVWVQ
jgi:hypothetical protein